MVNCWFFSVVLVSLNSCKEYVNDTTYNIQKTNLTPVIWNAFIICVIIYMGYTL